MKVMWFSNDISSNLVLQVLKAWCLLNATVIDSLEQPEWAHSDYRKMPITDIKLILHKSL
jgi:hypothetical protein